MTETLGRFLSNVIEFIIAGILFTSTICLSFRAIYPEDFDRAWVRVTQDVASQADSVIFVAIIAYAYVAGILAETFSRRAFEWRLNQIKASRRRKDPAVGDHGNMRFAVMAASPELYLEVDSQVKRMRIERVVALCATVGVGLSAALLVASVTPLRIAVLVALAGILVVTLAQVNDRFHRYCRAIERGYAESRSKL